MLYGVLLIVIVIGLSGLISYLGDQIGMKVGKKRISLFGLRPRYTSIIITVITGILIACLAITVILVTNNAVRQAIFDINQVLTTLNRLNTELEERNQQLEELNQDLLQKDRDLREKEEEIDFRKEQLSGLQEHISTLQTTLDTTREEFQQARQDISELQNTKEELETQRDGLLTQIDELQDKVLELDEESKSLESKIEGLNAELLRVTEEASQFKAGIEYYMGEEIVYERGEVIYLDVIEVGSSQEEIIQEITSFLEKANQVVKEKPVRVDEEVGTALQLQFDQILNVASTIFNSDTEKVIVSLVASYNVPRNNWVFADFQINESFIVFEKGELIASKELNASQQTSILEQELRSLLNELNTIAIRAGLLTDPQGLVGSIDFSHFYQILSEISRHEGRIEVKVYAGENIWREDRLSSNLKFDIRAIEGE